MTTYWHGGVPDLRPGDVIRPGHERRYVDGCPWCEAHKPGSGMPAVIDGPPVHPDMVYITTVREYARYYASLYGRGDLYRVEPVGDVQRSAEDTVETWMAPAARVVSVFDRAVQLTWSQRRRLMRMWKTADELHLATKLTGRLGADVR